MRINDNVPGWRPRGMSNKKRCLVVDDSDTIREIAARLISAFGVETFQAVSVDQAVEFCSNEKPDVVFLDWDLPGMGALDFLRAVGGFAEENRPQIILSATENDPQQFTLAKAAGAAHHILKPFDREGVGKVLYEAGIITKPETGSSPKSAEAH